MFKKLFQSEILKGTLYALGGKMVAMLLYMAFDIACARLMSPNDYAEWVFFYAILTMMFYIGWCGINASAKVFVSKESTEEGVAKTIQASFLLRLIASIVISVILISIAFPLAKCLGYPDKYPNLYHLCISAGLLVFLNSYSEFFKELFMGLGNFKKLCSITVLEFTGYFLFSLIFLTLMKKVEAVAIGYICSGVVVFLFGMICLRRISPNGIFPWKIDNYQTIMNTVFRYAVPIAISSIGGMILVEMDTFMLGILSTKSQVANYGIAKNLCAKATHINYALTVGSMTSFAVLTVENIKEKRLKLIKTSSLNEGITVVIAGLFLSMGTFVISILYGVEYEDAGKILKYLVPYYIMYSISNFFATFLDFQGKAKVRSVCYCTTVLLNFILNLIFIQRIGAIGAAVATSLSLVPYTILVIAIALGVVKSYSKKNPA